MESLPATEWSLPFEGQPPDSLRLAVDKVVALTRGLAEPTQRSGAVAAPDRPRVVTVLGDRGVGKSTALQFSLQRLRMESSCLVVPTIDPEGFARGDSLAGWVLAHLQHLLSDVERGTETAKGQSLGGQIEELSRIQAIRSSGFLPGLEHRGLTFEDFSRDAIKVPYRNVQVGKLWAAAVEDLAEVKGREDLQLIVPIDDADLTPSLLPGIVNDAQLLGASPRVAIIFAAADTTLRQSLGVSLVASHGGIASAALQYDLLSAPEVRSLVERRLVKSFPRSLRVRLDPLDVEARLDFCPISFTQSIADLLSGFTVSLPGYETLADFFYIRSESGETLEPSPYARALSDNPRDLRQMHEALAAVQPDEDRAASRAMATVLAHGMEAVRDSLPPALPPDPWSVDYRQGLPRLDFKFDQIKFGRTTDMGTPVYFPPEDPNAESDLMIDGVLYMRRETAHYTSFQPPESDADDSATPRLLPEQFSYLTFLAWEVIQEDARTESLVDRGRMQDSLVRPGGSHWVRAIYAPGPDERWTYWTVPDWDSYSDYFVFSAGWNRLHRLSRDVDPAPGDTRWVELLLVSHIRLVLATQKDRHLPDDFIHLDLSAVESVLDTWKDEGRAAGLQQIRASVESLYKSTPTLTSTRDRDFTNWFEDLFPMMASRLCCGPELSAGLFEIWDELVEPSHREIAVSRLAETTARHLQLNLAEADIELLSRIDPKRAEQLAAVRLELLSAAAETSASVLGDLERASVSSQILDTLKELGATREVLVALVARGVRTDLIARVAEAFPPKSDSANAESEPRSPDRHGPE